MLDFFADFHAKEALVGFHLRASTMQDALVQVSIIEFYDPGLRIERISKKATRGVEYKVVGK